jgi:hypothetical protein
VSPKNSIKILRVQLLPFPSSYCASIFLGALCLSLATTASWYNPSRRPQASERRGRFFCNLKHHSEHDATHCWDVSDQGLTLEALRFHGSIPFRGSDVPLQIVEAILIIKRVVISAMVPAASSSKIARVKFVVLRSYQATSPRRRETTKSQPTGYCHGVAVMR